MIEKILKTTFGHDQFRPMQKDIIQTTLEGKDSFVLMPTGGGKSLCYQVPALCFSGVTLVISPLIALMKDQVDQLQEKGIPAAFLNSSLSIKEQNKREEDFFFGRIKILYISPERFVLDSFQELINEVELSFIAIDEAHCISQWGHDFRPDYKKSGKFIKKLKSTPIMALTASACEATRVDILKILGMKSAKVFQTSFERKNLFYELKAKTNKKDDFQSLAKFISKELALKQGPGIVYCLSRKKTEDYCEFLSRLGIRAFAYHAGMGTKERERVQELFASSDEIVIIATIAFGMGIDKKNIRFVAHLDQPKSIEAYYQETGRAGRDGKPSKLWLVYGKQELVMLRKMINRLSVKRRGVGIRKLNLMRGLCETLTCRNIALLNYLGERSQRACGQCDNCLKNVSVSVVDVSSHAIKLIKFLHENKESSLDDTIVRISKSSREVELHEKVLTELQMMGALYLTLDQKEKRELSSIALEIVEGKKKVLLRKSKKATKTTRKRNSPLKILSSQKADLSSLDDEKALEYLKQFRKDYARSKRTKAYKVFPDRTLSEFIESRPKSLEEMKEIYGVGPKKLKKYGKAFLVELSKLG